MNTTQLQPGQSITFWIQKGWRPGRVLAVIGQEALMEYEMPEGTTSLVFISADTQLTDEHVAKGTHFTRNPYGYERLPLRWLKAIIDNDMEWLGRSQTGPVLAASELLKKRTRGSASDFGWIDYHTRHERTFRGKTICITVEVWGWTILIDGEVLGQLRKGLASLDLAKSLAVGVAITLPKKGS